VVHSHSRLAEPLCPSRHTGGRWQGQTSRGRPWARGQWAAGLQTWERPAVEALQSRAQLRLRPGTRRLVALVASGPCGAPRPMLRGSRTRRPRPHPLGMSPVSGGAQPHAHRRAAAVAAAPLPAQRLQTGAAARTILALVALAQLVASRVAAQTTSSLRPGSVPTTPSRRSAWNSKALVALWPHATPHGLSVLQWRSCAPWAYPTVLVAGLCLRSSCVMMRRAMPSRCSSATAPPALCLRSGCGVLQTLRGNLPCRLDQARQSCSSEPWT